MGACNSSASAQLHIQDPVDIGEDSMAPERTAATAPASSATPVKAVLETSSPATPDEPDAGNGKCDGERVGADESRGSFQAAAQPSISPIAVKRNLNASLQKADSADSSSSEQDSATAGAAFTPDADTEAAARAVEEKRRRKREKKERRRRKRKEKAAREAAAAAAQENVSPETTGASPSSSSSSRNKKVGSGKLLAGLGGLKPLAAPNALLKGPGGAPKGLAGLGGLKPLGGIGGTKGLGGLSGLKPLGANVGGLDHAKEKDFLARYKSGGSTSS